MSGNEKPNFSNALAVGRELDLTLPDSPAVRDAYAQAEAESQPWLFNHVVRSWLYGAKLAQRRGLAPDAELVAVAVLLHDLGLARGGAPDRRFEVVGADIGRAFALSHDMGERRAETVWDSIALHTTASIAQHKGTDVACCQNGIACDYGGLGYQRAERRQQESHPVSLSSSWHEERADDVPLRHRQKSSEYDEGQFHRRLRHEIRPRIYARVLG